MKQHNIRIIHIVIIVLVLLIICVSNLLYIIGRSDRSSEIEMTSAVAVETESQNIDTVGTEVQEILEDSMFDFVSINDYRNDVDNLMRIVNCQYNNDYEWSDILTSAQSEYIKVELQKRFPNKSTSVDITPKMLKIYNDVKSTVFNESMSLFPGSLASDDICEEEEVMIESTSSDTGDNIGTTYPIEFYDCMKTEDGYLSSSLNDDILISRILDEYPRLTYNKEESKWYLSKIDENEQTYEIFNNIIELINPLEQMEGISLYRFSIDSLRRYKDYLILSVYRRSSHLNLKVRKVDGIYEILNIDDLISVLAE